MNIKSIIIAAIALTGFVGNATAKDNITATYLTNADLSSLTGWNYGDSFNGGTYNYTDWKTDGDVPVIEFYHTWSADAGSAIGSTKNFHFTQTITLPAGYYRLAVNAFYREGNGNGTNTKAYIFAGDKQQYIVGLSANGLKAYSGSNDLYKAANAFSQGAFSNEFDFHLTEQKEITIGFRGYIDTYCSWCILGPVTLYEYTVEDYLEDLKTRCDLASGYDGLIPAAALAALTARANEIKNATYNNIDEVLAAMDELSGLYASADQLKTPYADYYNFKSQLTTLKSGMNDTDKTEFDATLSQVDTQLESATTTAAINSQKANLRAAALTFISNTDGQFDITFLASRQSSDWKKKDGSAAGEVTWAVSNRGEWTFAESYEGTCETTGTVLYQTVSDLPAGYYQVGMYAMAAYTPGREFATQATEGDANRSFAFAGNSDDASSILRTGIAIPFKTSFDFSELTTLDVNVHLSATGDLTFGVQKDMNGSNWHFAQIASIVYSNQPDLTNLIATRNALVAQAEGLLSGSAAYLTVAQQTALQDAIDAGNAASTFDDLNTVTLTTLPDAINVANQQVQLVKDNRVLMLAALERFENDYNLSDGTDYSRQTMSASAWTSLIEKVNAVSTALDDVSQATSYGTIKDALVAQMDATDQSLRLFKSYKAMVEGVSGVLGSSAAEPYAAASNMDTDATQQTAIAALNAAFVDYANNQDASFDVSAFLGANLDFSAAEGAALNTANSNNIHAVEGWDVDYADADTWATLQTHQSANDGKLYIRKNWGSAAATLTVTKQKMLPAGRYRLSIEWNSTLANMTNLSAFTLDGASTAIGKATTGAETLTYEFEVSDAATPCDIIIGFKKQNTGDAAAQIVADNITLTYLTNVVTLGNTTDNTATIAAANGQKANVVLDGRTLYKDGSWNTICLPFNLDIAGSLLDGDGVTLMTLDGTTSNYSAGTLTLNFTTADAIQAGKPYIIKWNNTGADIVNPRFIGVTLDATSPAAVATSDNAAQFVATYSPVDIDALGDNTKLYISTDNNIYWPNAAMTIGSQRAYFQLQGTLTAGDADTSAGIRAINLNFDGTETLTAIDAVENGKSVNGKSIYNLNGQQLSAPQRGINIVDGKKVFVK